MRAEPWRRIDQYRERCARSITALTTLSAAACAPVEEPEIIASQEDRNTEEVRVSKQQPEPQQQQWLQPRHDQQAEQQQVQRESQQHPLHKQATIEEMDWQSAYPTEKPQDMQQLQQEARPQAHLPEDRDALLVSLLATEAHAAALPHIGDGMLQAPSSAAIRPSRFPPAAERAAIDPSTWMDVAGFAPRELPAAAATLGVKEGAHPGIPPLRPETAGSITGAVTPSAETAQLQWIREALILLRRIDDPQHVQLQRRKKTTPAPAAGAPGPVPDYSTGNIALAENHHLGAGPAAPSEAGHQGPASRPTSRSYRTLYVQWVGAGGGPWGGRSDTWLQQRRCVGIQRHAKQSTGHASSFRHIRTRATDAK